MQIGIVGRIREQDGTPLRGPRRDKPPGWQAIVFVPTHQILVTNNFRVGSNVLTTGYHLSTLG
jgi:hypothetical protein